MYLERMSVGEIRSLDLLDAIQNNRLEEVEARIRFLQ
jgi:hypothetical protein